MRLLVVDDSKVMRVALGKAVARIGHEVAAEAKDGLEAIEQYAVSKPDAVLLDVNMPGIDGIETARRLCAADPKAKIVMVSARGEYDLITEALIAGAKAYIAKPVADATLQETLKNLAAPENTQSRVLVADSAVVFRKLAQKALQPLNIGPAVEAKDGIETVLAACKNPALTMLVLSEELVGLPAKNVLAVLQAKGLLSGKKVVLFREGGGVIAVPKGVELLGMLEKTNDIADLTKSFEALLNPETNAHPQFELALKLASAYLENIFGKRPGQERLMRTGNAYFEGDQWLEADELLLTLEHWILEYLHEEGETHAVQRMMLMRLIKGSTASEAYLPALPDEHPAEPEPRFVNEEEAKGFLNGCKHRGIEVDMEAAQTLGVLFTPLFEFAESAAPLYTYEPKFAVRWGNYAAVAAMIGKNQRLIPSRFLLPLRDAAYRHLHAISPEIDQPALFECEGAILTLLKIQKRIQTIFETDPKTLFERVFLPKQPTFCQLKKLGSAELNEQFLKEEFARFKEVLALHAKGVRQLALSLLDLYTHHFFQTLLDLGRRSSKIGAVFLAGKSNPDLQLFHLLEAVLGKQNTDENTVALLEKAKQISQRHWVLASNHPEITEQFKNVIARTNPEWKFNRVSDGKMLLRWLEANQPSHLLLDTSLMVGPNQPTHAALLKSLPYLKCAVRITLITPANESLSETHRELFGRDIQLPIENGALARRLLLA